MTGNYDCNISTDILDITKIKCDETCISADISRLFTTKLKKSIANPKITAQVSKSESGQNSYLTVVELLTWCKSWIYLTFMWMDTGKVIF